MEARTAKGLVSLGASIFMFWILWQMRDALPGNHLWIFVGAAAATGYIIFHRMTKEDRAPHQTAPQPR